MPSPEVIHLTLSDDENQPDPIRSNQDTSTPTRATNRFRTSSSTPPMSGNNRTRRILPVIQGTFAAIERAENYLPLATETSLKAYFSHLSLKFETI